MASITDGRAVTDAYTALLIGEICESLEMTQQSQVGFRQEEFSLPDDLAALWRQYFGSEPGSILLQAYFGEDRSDPESTALVVTDIELAGPDTQCGPFTAAYRIYNDGFVEAVMEGDRPYLAHLIVEFVASQMDVDERTAAEWHG